jgi:hypothetical protein
MEQLAQTADDDSDSDDMFERDEHADLNSWHSICIYAINMVSLKIIIFITTHYTLLIIIMNKPCPVSIKPDPHSHTNT